MLGGIVIQSFGVIVQEVREETSVHPKTPDAHSLDTQRLVPGHREDLCSTGWISVLICSLLQVALGSDHHTASHGQWALLSRRFG